MERRQFLLGSFGGVAMAAAGFATPSIATTSNPTVRTTRGEVRGITMDGIHLFKGIPFAAPPLGANRLLPPQPHDTWDGVRDVLEFGPKPPQAAYPPMVADLIPPEVPGPGDNCLTLNIWTPDLGEARLPVMIWIAGGMFEYHGTGASPWYDGSAFARDGVILVSINYRVGAEGFLYLGDGIANLGLLDQLAALTWVQDNIGAFGGDPDKVTIFGESAGGLSVGTLLSMPRSAGLFRRAIIESGGGHHVTSAATAERIGRRLADKLGVAPQREAIAALPIARLIAAQDELRGELMTDPDPQFWAEVMLTGLPWEPVADGDVVPARPIDRIAAGAGAEIDLMAGSNIEEWRLFLVPGGAIDAIPNEALGGTIAASGLPVEETLNSYAELHLGASAGDLFAAIMTDWYWRIPALRAAEAHAAQQKARTFMYEFAWRSPAFEGRLGAAHALEIPFVFDTFGDGTERLLGPNPPRALAQTMHQAWVNFASNGDPGWPQFDLERKPTMHFDVASTIVDDPLARESKIWQGAR
jgi:carboxylesterase 2/para-nitrobenzyl esterase